MATDNRRARLPPARQNDNSLANRTPCRRARAMQSTLQRWTMVATCHAQEGSQDIDLCYGQLPAPLSVSTNHSEECPSLSSKPHKITVIAYRRPALSVQKELPDGPLPVIARDEVLDWAAVVAVVLNSAVVPLAGLSKVIDAILELVALLAI